MPEALTEGQTMEEALREGRDALTATLAKFVGIRTLAEYVLVRRDIPHPSAPHGKQKLVHLSPLIASKLALFENMRRNHISNVELARRMGVTENVIRRLIDPDHRSHIGQVEASLDLLHVRLTVEAFA